jgi:hypothetical protein
MLNPGAEAGEIEAGGGEATFARAMLDGPVGDGGIDRLEQRIRAGRDNHAPECTLRVRAARPEVIAWTWPTDTLTVSR